MMLITVEEDNKTNTAKRIISKNRVGLVCNATRKQAMARLTAKENEKITSTTPFVAKKDHAKDKRAKDTSVHVTTGSEILKRLEHRSASSALRS